MHCCINLLNWNFEENKIIHDFLGFEIEEQAKAGRQLFEYCYERCYGKLYPDSAQM